MGTSQGVLLQYFGGFKTRLSFGIDRMLLPVVTRTAMVVKVTSTGRTESLLINNSRELESLHHTEHSAPNGHVGKH